MFNFSLLISANSFVLSGPGADLGQGMVVEGCGGTCSVESKFHLLSTIPLILT